MGAIIFCDVCQGSIPEHRRPRPQGATTGMFATRATPGADLRLYHSAAAKDQSPRRPRAQASLSRSQWAPSSSSERACWAG